MGLDPELGVFAGFRLPDLADIGAARRWEQALKASAPAPDPALSEDLAVADFTIPGPPGAPPLAVRLYRPDSPRALPVLVYFHGGSFVMGDLDTDHGACLRYAGEAGCAVLSVDYRLAPENPFPAALHDGHAALHWVAHGGSGRGLDPGRLALGGSSAGATLAAGLALLARDRGEVAVAFQLLLHPALDNRLTSPSINAPGQDFGVTRELVRQMWVHYLGGDGRAREPWAAPARAEDLAGLPPAYPETAELDPPRDELLDYAGRLPAAGVSMDVRLFAGAPPAAEVTAAARTGAHAVASRTLALRRRLRLP